jgi:uncharacterized membrane protein YdjX (TVP38/TMEM64 family)
MKKCKYIKILILIVIIIAVIFIIMQPQVRQNISSEKIAMFLRDYGRLAALIFILIYTIRPIFMILPVSIFAIAGGSVFGEFWGTIYGIVGNFTSATLAFILARYIMRDFIQGLIKKEVSISENRFENDGFKFILLIRYITPFDALSYAAGLSRIKYKDFITATVLVTIPEIFLYCYVGENITKVFRKGFFSSEEFIFSVLSVLIIAIMIIIVKKKKIKQ